MKEEKNTYFWKKYFYFFLPPINSLKEIRNGLKNSKKKSATAHPELNRRPKGELAKQ